MSVLEIIESIAQGKELLEAPETAFVLSCSTRTLAKITWPNGDLMPVRMAPGGKVRYSRRAIAEWIAKKEAAASIDLPAESLAQDSVR